MSFKFRILLLAICMAALAGCATSRADIVPTGLTLDGSWQGTLKISEDPEDVIHLRLLITYEIARVWTYERGVWFEAKPGSFRMSRHKSNAVIYATDSELDADGTWVESWAIVATPRSSEELLVVWSRVVNNWDMPLDNESSKFSSHASGVLYRTPRGQE